MSEYEAKKVLRDLDKMNPSLELAGHRYTEFRTVDAIDVTVVDALAMNPGWVFLHSGTGAGGQTTLTFAWPSPDVDVPVPHIPQRGSDVEAWLKAKRDECKRDGPPIREWIALDNLLDDYRLHADTGTPLRDEVEEPGDDPVEPSLVRTCPECGGAGAHIDNACSICDGTGVIAVES